MTRVHQKDFSAQQPEAQTAPRVSCAHGDQERPEGPGLAPRQGTQAPERLNVWSDLNPVPVSVERLRSRPEFLYVAGGYSERRRFLVVQGRKRRTERPAAGEGFTSTKKIGGAVARNRARRRLRAASRALLPALGVPGTDYVFIARQETGTASFARLLDDMEKALISLRRRFLTDGAPTPAASALPPAGA